jgi:hypothetical protein
VFLSSRLKIPDRPAAETSRLSIEKIQRENARKTESAVATRRCGKKPRAMFGSTGRSRRRENNVEHTFRDVCLAATAHGVTPFPARGSYHRRGLLMMFLRQKLLLLFLLGWMLALSAKADVLVFTDGDRVQGTFVRRENGKIIFQSLRFGNLSVPEADATVEVTTPPPPPIIAPMPSEAEGPMSLYEQILLTRLRRRVEQGIVRWWEPWVGRLAASTDIVHDAKDRSIFLAEGRVRRNWARDEVRLEARYEYREENEEKTVDMIKGTGLWRHDVSNRIFGSYRPLLERDRVNSNGFQPFPYILLQQQVGAGVHLLRRERIKLRAGVAENFFNVWAIDDEAKSYEHIESAFFEAEMALPWRITLTERGVWYYAIKDATQGWENEFEFSKKLTDSLSLGLRHEFRRNNPDSRVQDYERLRLLIGYDF